MSSGSVGSRPNNIAKGKKFLLSLTLNLIVANACGNVPFVEMVVQSFGHAII